MQIKVNLQIFLFIIIFILTHQIELYALIMLFAFIHEFGHIVMGLILKLKPKSLNIMPFGFTVTFETYEYRKLLEIKKIIIALAGPIVNIIIAFGIYFINMNINLKLLIIYSNITIAMFNLIPFYPLDGGRILKSFIKINSTDSIKADKIVNKISNVLLIIITIVSSFAIIYIKNIAVLFIIIYLWILNIIENKRFNLKKRAYLAVANQNKYIDN